MVVPNHSRSESYGSNVIAFDLDVDEEAFLVFIRLRYHAVVLLRGTHGPFEVYNLRKVFEYDLRSAPVIGHDPPSQIKNKASCSRLKLSALRHPSVKKVADKLYEKAIAEHIRDSVFFRIDKTWVTSYLRYDGCSGRHAPPLPNT